MTGKIKTITQLVGLVNKIDDEPEKWWIRSLIRFDKNDNMVEDSVFLSNGTLESRNTYSYNERNQLIEHSVFSNEEEISEKTLTHYDKDNIVKQEVIYGDGSLSIKTFTKTNNILNAIITDEEGEYEGKEIQIFNSKGQVIEECIYDENDTVQEKIIRQYDEAGHVVLRIEYGMEEEFRSKRIFEYDNNGNPVMVIDLNDADEVIHRRSSSFDENNNVVKENIDGYVLLYTYDDKNQRIKEEILDPYGNTETFTEYIYDDEKRIQQSISYNSAVIRATGSSALSSGLFPFTLSKYQYEYEEGEH